MSSTANQFKTLKKSERDTEYFARNRHMKVVFVFSDS